MCFCNCENNAKLLTHTQVLKWLQLECGLVYVKLKDAHRQEQGAV